MRPIAAALCLCAAVLNAASFSETGEINGAQFRIDVPDQWTGVLILYCHGYNANPVRFDDKPNPLIDAFLKQGYAIARSGYAAGGWAIQEAVTDTESLRRYFISRKGAPKETWVMGHSMGGFLTMMLMETYPTTYEGGLALCGPLAPAHWFLDRGFQWLAAFQYYFPNAVPSPDHIPADFAMNPGRNAEIEKLLAARPPQAQAMRRLTGIKTDKEFAGTVVFMSYVMKDLQQRSGGNPFDNTNTIYEGSGLDDNALNDGVPRYAAKAQARDYLRRFYTPTGEISRPMLALHTTYDVLVPPHVPNHYAHLAANAGRGDLFVQQYVKRDGHCQFTPGETLGAFERLRAWRREGRKPAGGAATSQSN